LTSESAAADAALERVSQPKGCIGTGFRRGGASGVGAAYGAYIDTRCAPEAAAPFDAARDGQRSASSSDDYRHYHRDAHVPVASYGKNQRDAEEKHAQG
jgi:hypothetical protein